MKYFVTRCAAIFVLFSGLVARGNTLYVDLNSGNPTPPFSDWSTAATNIQDAIDASSDGDQIWVTNGVYQTGGKVVVGNLTNRVVLDKAVTVQSVNGPLVTTIAGIGATNSLTAVRCAWLTNNASLVGFTLARGATRTTSSDSTNLMSGGGVWCASSNAVVTDCVIASNTAYSRAGAAFQGTLNNCFITGNSVGLLSPTAGAVVAGMLNNCTVVNNWVGLASCQATNCICYYNQSGNYNGGTFAYSCTTPAAAGTGNFTNAPQFFADRIHLALGSPGLGAGTTPVTSADIFGHAWGNPPAVGCAETAGVPQVGLLQVQFASAPLGFTVGNALISGAGPFTFSWLKEGAPLQDDGHYSFTQSSNLHVAGITFADVGDYQLVVGNAFGTVTSLVAHVAIRCVNVASANPVTPYISWDTAATNIQDAIDASADWNLVWVTNGIYQAGGKVISGDLTNRVVLDKPVTVQSVNGPLVTTITGLSTTNGTTAVRCAWLTDNASLVGFTLTGGATRIAGDTTSLESGGGVWCTSSNAAVTDCIIVSNTAAFQGGGGYQGTFNNCYVRGNSVSPATANGALRSAVVNSCTVVSNTAAGLSACQATNSICYFNLALNYNGSSLSYCCVTPAASGIGNFTNAPVFFADNIHLALGSPGIGAGTTPVTGADLFGRTWSAPPTVGCAESLGSPYVSSPQIQLTGSPFGFTISAAGLGDQPLSYAWLRNGSLLADDGHFGGTQSTHLTAGGIVFADGADYQFVASNSSGAVTSSVAHLTIHCVDAAGNNPLPPFTSWATAATNIQDAIDAAGPNEIVLVTNGVYSSGGKMVAGDITNRVVLDKALIVTSVNGYANTVIEGLWDPATTNGPASVRCAWLTNGATLNGFTLRNGSTHTGDGGGALLYFNSILSNCALTNNNAANYGGGMAEGIANNCFFSHNIAQNGGGAYQASLNNCTLRGNNCYNITGGAGVFTCISRNCIIRDNYTSVFGAQNYQVSDYSSSSSDRFTNCCTSFSLPLLSRGTNNLTVDPLFLDYNGGFALCPASPCRGAGNPQFVAGYDLDGEPYLNPPVIGCDEIITTNLTGPLAFTFLRYGTNTLPNHGIFFASQFEGRPSELDWSFGDGPVVTNIGVATSHNWTNTGTYTVTLTAYNADHPLGVSSNLLVNVDPLLTPALQFSGIVSNSFQFSFSNQPGAIYFMQYSTNLTPPATWQFLQYIPRTNGETITIRDLGVSNSPRFYRVMAQ